MDNNFFKHYININPDYWKLKSRDINGTKGGKNFEKLPFSLEVYKHSDSI